VILKDCLKNFYIGILILKILKRWDENYKNEETPYISNFENFVEIEADQF